MFVKAALMAAAIGGVVAQRPMDMPICDFYTTALLKNNTAVNQKTLLTLVVNTAVIGNYTQPNVGIMVPGILAPGMVNGTRVNLAGYFNGGFASTNDGGAVGVARNFLDGGGAEPLLKNMPANDTTSAQYLLLKHLYEYFGALLGCTLQGDADFNAYSGDASMYEVHKFMGLSNAEMTYFISQVALAAASFGVAQSDLEIIGKALNGAFNVRCAPPTTIIPPQGPQLQSICVANDCALSPNATCDAYAKVVKPSVVNATLAGTNQSPSSIGSPSGASRTSGSIASATGSGAAATSSAAGAAVGISFAAVAGGLAALLL